MTEREECDRNEQQYEPMSVLWVNDSEVKLRDFAVNDERKELLFVRNYVQQNLSCVEGRVVIGIRSVSARIRVERDMAHLLSVGG